MSLTRPELRIQRRTLVEYATDWPRDTNGHAWTADTSLICLEACEPFANDVGSALIARMSGKVVAPGAIVSSSREPLNIRGKWIRVSVEVLDTEDATGSEYNAELDTNFMPIWWGVCRARSYKTAEVGLEEQYSCAGLPYVLDQITMRYGYQETASLPSVVQPWRHFNERPGGDRSQNLYDIPNGNREVYVQADNAVDALVALVQEWTAAQALDLILAAVRQQTSSAVIADTAPDWIVAGQTTALNYVEAWAIDGSALEMASRLINPRHGLGARTYVNGDGDAVLQVFSSLPAAITAGGITIPAAADPIAELDLSTDRGANDWELVEDDDSCFDYIGAEGDHPWWALTLGFKNDGSGQLVKGWTSAQETDWDTATDEEREQGDLRFVWRRFVFRRAWAGETYAGGTAWQFGRAVATSDLHGVGGETGAHTALASGTVPDPSGYRFTNALPMHEGYKWDEVTQSGDTADSIDKTRPLMPPQVYAVKDDGWLLLADLLGVGDVRVQVEDHRCGLLVGNNAETAVAIKAASEAGQDLVFTVGVEHPLPLRVSWRRDPSARPRNQDRQLVVPLPKARQWVIADDTVVRVKEGTAYYPGPGTLYVIDDRNRMKQALALLVPWYATPAIKFSWREEGVINIDTTKVSGRMITAARVPTGIASPTSRSYALATVITRRHWNFREEAFGTSYTTGRIATDVQAIFSSGANL